MKKPRLENHRSKLPDGWVWCKLGEIAQINPRHPPNVVPEDAEVSFIPMPAIDENNWRFKEVQKRPFGKVRKGYTHFAEGDVLFAKITPCMENGKAAIARGLINGIGCGTTELHVIRPQNGIPPELIYYYIHQETFREKAAVHMTGTAGQLRVPIGFMKEVPISLPPLPEQRLIVSRVETLLERVKKTEKHLDRVSQVIKRFRQAVLKKAFSGELTAEWREEHPELEPAEELLERIQEERKRRYEEEVRKARAEGKRPPKKPKYLGSKPLDTSDLPELPEGWTWVCIREVGEVVTGTTPSKNHREYYGDFIPFVKPTDLDIKFVKTANEFLSAVGAQVARIIPAGSIMVTSIGATIGKTGFALVPVVTNQQINSIICSQFVCPKFVFYYCISEFFQDRILQQSSSTTLPITNKSRFEQIELPLPPLPEQEEIVRRIEALLGFADKVEEKVGEARNQVEKITQSILSKAFRGELTEDFREAVKNWKNLSLEERRKYLFTLPKRERRKVLYSDEFPLEPASALLSRIKGKETKSTGESASRRKKEPEQLELWDG